MNSGHAERAVLIKGFLGTPGDKQISIIAEDPTNYADVPWITEDALIRMGKIVKIDFLKCDIEGGEFDLLSEKSRLLEMTRSLAVEVHAFAGDVEKFAQNLIDKGFTIRSRADASDGSTVILAARL